MERSRRLRDRLAVPAGELFAHRIDHFEPARDLLQRRGDALAELRQPRRAAARTLRRSRQNDALPLDVVGIWLANRPLALERAHGLRLFGCLLGDELILGRGRLELLQLQFQLIEQPRRAFRARSIERPSQLLDLELQMGDQRLGARQLRLRIRCFGELRFRDQARRTLGDNHRMRGGEIGRKRFSGDFHKPNGITFAIKFNDKLSAHARRTPTFLGVSPIDSGQKIRHLRLRDRHRAVRQRRP